LNFLYCYFIFINNECFVQISFILRKNSSEKDGTNIYLQVHIRALQINVLHKALSTRLYAFYEPFMSDMLA